MLDPYKWASADRESMYISQAFSAYATDVIAFRGQSRKTEENHYTCMRALIRYFGDVDATKLTFSDVRNWKLELDKTRTAETVRNYVIRLRVVLAYLKAHDYDSLDPDLVPVPKRTDKVPEFITKEDVAQLIRATTKLRNKVIISLLYASGIRVSELCALNRADLRDNSFTVVGKGGKARLCFIDQRTATLLDLYLESRKDNNPALFTGKFSSHRLTAGNVQEIFRYARRRAGFNTPVHPHTMRHSFATNLMSNGMHIYQLQQLLGHSSIQTTGMYLHVTDPQLQESYAKHHTT